jgi:hypothetical protein
MRDLLAGTAVELGWTRPSRLDAPRFVPVVARAADRR